MFTDGDAAIKQDARPVKTRQPKTWPRNQIADTSRSIPRARSSLSGVGAIPFCCRQRHCEKYVFPEQSVLVSVACTF